MKSLHLCTLVVMTLGVLVSTSFGKKSHSHTHSSSSSSSVVNGGGVAPAMVNPGYSQPIGTNGLTPVSYSPSPVLRQDLYSYGPGGQPMMAAASTQTEYYQPMDQGGYVAPTYGTATVNPTYARHHAPPVPTGYYEPVPQSSGHHHIKRGHHGWGVGGGGGEGHIGGLLLPLILIPLILCWPWFLYAASHHHHPIVYTNPHGWKRSNDGSVKEAKDKKVDELGEKILPNLD